VLPSYESVNVLSSFEAIWSRLKPLQTADWKTPSDSLLLLCSSCCTIFVLEELELATAYCCLLPCSARKFSISLQAPLCKSSLLGSSSLLSILYALFLVLLTSSRVDFPVKGAHSSPLSPLLDTFFCFVLLVCGNCRDASFNDAKLLRCVWSTQLR
jgi:hypothetical protein